jgi:hypothetical protein
MSARMNGSEPMTPHNLIGDAVLGIVEQVVAPLRAEVEELRAELEEVRTRVATPRVLSLKQACVQLGVGKTKFYELLATTDLAGTRGSLPGNRFDRDLLMAWIDRRAGVARRKQPKASRRRTRSASRLQRRKS